MDQEDEWSAGLATRRLGILLPIRRMHETRSVMARDRASEQLGMPLDCKQIPGTIDMFDRFDGAVWRRSDDSQALTKTRYRLVVDRVDGVVSLTEKLCEFAGWIKPNDRVREESAFSNDIVALGPCERR